MQVIRLKPLSLLGVRQLFSPSALGIDGFINTRNRIKTQFEEIEDKFKAKMTDFTKPEAASMIFTEDLKHMIHLTGENNEDLNLVKQMMIKFNQQNKDLRFGRFVFGPVVMRMYYVLNKPLEALEVFNAIESDFFDQLATYQILMDLLLKNNMLTEVIEVFDKLKKKQINGTTYPRNCVVLVLAACYKLNTPESYNYAKKLWSDLNQTGHYPMRRAGTFAAALAIEQNEPGVALEILTSMKQQGYVTVRNLKVSALADLGRPDDALPLLRTSLNADRATEKKSTYCEEVISKLTSAVEKFGRTEITQEYEHIEKQLREARQISNMPLSELLCSEIISEPTTRSSSNEYRASNRREQNYSRRPGLMDML